MGRFQKASPSTSNKLMMFHNTQSPTKISVRPEWTSLHDWLHQLAIMSTGWALCFSSTSSPYINQHSTIVNFFAYWPLTFFLGANFFPTLTLLHTTLPPSYTINLPTLPTYLLAYTLNPTNSQPIPYLPFLSFLGKTYIFSWLNLFLFLVRLLFLGKTYISSWLNIFGLLEEDINVKDK